MRDVDGDYEAWKNGTSVECPYFSLVYNSSANESSLLRSTVDLQPKGVYFETMSNYIFSINVYTYTGYVLARIPLRIDVNRYPSIYIDKMAKYDGGIKIDETLGTIYAPRFLAGRYENPDNIGNTGNKQFSGVAIGDFADKDTEASMAIPGIYGFKQGQQAYAFRNNATGFIGANGNTRITFNNGGSGQEVLTIGDTNYPVFSVNAAGDVNLTGSVTGSYNGNGYKLNKNGQGYIRHGNYGIYFQPGSYPIYISDENGNGDNASFAVDQGGNLNLRGSNIYINGNMEFRSGGLNNYVTDSELNNALSNIDTSIDSEDFKNKLSELIDNSQGLFWNGSKLTINASNINGSLIQGVKVRAGDIEAGTLNGLVGDGINLNDIFITQAQGNDVGQLGSAEGSYADVEGNLITTYGTGMTAGTLQVNELGKLHGYAIQDHGGSYSMVTTAGYRGGYYYGSWEGFGVHNRILITRTDISLICESNSGNTKHSITLDRDGNLSLSNISNIKINNKKVKIQYAE